MLRIGEKTIDEIRGVFEDGCSKFPDDAKGLLDYTLWVYNECVNEAELILDVHFSSSKDFENFRGIVFEEMIFFLQKHGIIDGDWYGS